MKKYQYLSIYLALYSFRLYVFWLCTFLSIQISICVSILPSIYFSIYLYICLFNLFMVFVLYESFVLYIHLIVNLSIHLFINPSKFANHLCKSQQLNISNLSIYLIIYSYLSICTPIYLYTYFLATYLNINLSANKPINL